MSPRAPLAAMLWAAAALAQPPGTAADVTPEPAAPGVAKLPGIPLWFDGYFWADTGYMSRANNQPGQYDQSAAYLQGRFALGANYLGSHGDWFGLARVQLLGLVNEYAKSQYEPHTLDAYVELGHKRWANLRVGRFLAWEVYHRGQGIELWTAEEAGALQGPSLYWLDQTRGYMNEAGQAAVHFFPLEALAFEVAGVYGQDSGQNVYGVRPVADFKLKGFELIAGYEYLKRAPQTEADKVQVTTHGAAARAEYRFPYVRVGGEYAWTQVERIDIQGLVDSDLSLTKMTFGGFADVDFWRNSIGLGFHHTQQLNRQGERNTHEQAFVSYLFRLPLDGLSAKVVYGFAFAHVEDFDSEAAFNNVMHSVRLRLAYELR